MAFANSAARAWAPTSSITQHLVDAPEHREPEPQPLEGVHHRVVGDIAFHLHAAPGNHDQSVAIARVEQAATRHAGRSECLPYALERLYSFGGYKGAVHPDDHAPLAFS